MKKEWEDNKRREKEAMDRELEEIRLREAIEFKRRVRTRARHCTNTCTHAHALEHALAYTGMHAHTYIQTCMHTFTHTTRFRCLLC